MPLESKTVPTEPRDVYLDIEEVLWKEAIADAYRRVITILHDAQLLDDPVIHELHIRIIDIINSNHDQAVFNERSKVVHQQLKQRLLGLGQDATVQLISEIITNTRRSMVSMMSTRQQANISRAHGEQTYIQDGVIRLAGKDIETFSSQPDYLGATLELMHETSAESLEYARESFARGFRLTQEELNLVERCRLERWDIPEVITSILVLQQTKGRFPSIQNYEFQPSLSAEENHKRKLAAINEAYFLMAKIVAAVGHSSAPEDASMQEVEEVSDPIQAFMNLSGKASNPQQVDAVRTVALAHSSHGLNSGELTARLAGSVRTSFPRALIASFNIRSGVLHSGAVRECMDQTGQFLKGDQDAETFIRSIVGQGQKFYGFGHRIHKTDARDPVQLLGKDPRVALYINATQKGFPEKADTIKRLIGYAEAVRRVRPSLGANTDFGAAILFHAMQLSPQAAEGFFAAFRCAGVCANIINELQIKGNSRRPPFPEVLPYPTQ
jgi:citrate synthase